MTEKHIAIGCTNFNRRMVDAKREIQFCSKKGMDIGCASSSDLCPMPRYFQSDRGIPNERILFKRDFI